MLTFSKDQFEALDAVIKGARQHLKGFKEFLSLLRPYPDAYFEAYHVIRLGQAGTRTPLT